MANHDEGYKNLFKHPEMVEDLLRGFVDAPWVKEVDFSTLERLPHEYTVDKKLKKRASDTIWRVRCRDSWLYLIILLEFQSRPDPVMAFRIMSYVSLLYLDFHAEKRFETIKQGKHRKLQFPPIFPIVLYNGKGRWHKAQEVSELIAEPPLGLEPYRPQLRYCLIDERAYADHELELRNLVAALFRLEKSQTEEDVDQVLKHLVIWLDSPEQKSLDHAFTAWLSNILLPKRYPDTEFHQVATLEGVRSMLAETVQGWYDKVAIKNREEGVAEGKAEGIAEGKVKGKAEGIAEGIAKGKAKLLILMLEKCFQPMSEAQKNRIFALNDEQMIATTDYLLQSTSLDEVFAQLDKILTTDQH
jgi:hypothetical protein